MSKFSIVESTEKVKAENDNFSENVVPPRRSSSATKTKPSIAPGSRPVLKASGSLLDIASEFCTRRARALIFYRGDLFEWRETHYRPISTDSLLTEIYSFLAGALVKVPVKNSEGDTEWTTAPFPYDDRTTRKVLDALKHLEGKVFVP